jgi:hypothetical protein
MPHAKAATSGVRMYPNTGFSGGKDPSFSEKHKAQRCRLSGSGRKSGFCSTLRGFVITAVYPLCLFCALMPRKTKTKINDQKEVHAWKAAVPV